MPYLAALLSENAPDPSADLARFPGIEDPVSTGRPLSEVATIVAKWARWRNLQQNWTRSALARPYGSISHSSL